MNNLKQLALASHNFTETADCHELPQGSIPDSAKEPADRLGVLVALLPYVERDEVYKQFDLNQGWAVPANGKAAATVVKTFLCPAMADTGKTNHANYGAITGLGDDAASLPARHPRAGAFGYDRSVQFGDVRDGTSRTVFFVETHRDLGPWASASATLRGVDPDDETPIGKGRAFGVHHSASEWNWGRMPGEANAAFIDGSVRTLNADTSARVLSDLATIAGDRHEGLDW